MLETAVNHLLAERHFSICRVDDLIKLTGGSEKRDAYRMLHSLHCVHYADMPKELRNAIPGLINECLRQEPVAPGPATQLVLEGVTFVSGSK